ncbi:response regulator receiver domain-containing protein [Litoreibacter ponti]|uniref:Response regulator receiver domain-containing protein n=1 Tax=Litoreibacter ponti TaxID=1510457 RepID=A0A2T6BKL3_9RHOB|nr:response regulator [Litoreibacter ponti]PTX56586.1 response regulator receiver domain-containing protein [Litoreibacter ponti]
MHISPKARTVMVVDDERVDQVLYERVLRKAGLCKNVIGFLSPNDALDYLCEEARPKIDVILLDVNMPERSGFDFLEQAMAEHGEELADTVVLMVSSVQCPQNKKRAEEIGAVKKFLPKPLTANQVQGLNMLLMAKDQGQRPISGQMLH